MYTHSPLPHTLYPHITKRHMICNIMCQSITLQNIPKGKDDKFTYDTYSGLIPDGVQNNTFGR
jgi:hypothetical protein